MRSFGGSKVPWKKIKKILAADFHKKKNSHVDNPPPPLPPSFFLGIVVDSFGSSVVANYVGCAPSFNAKDSLLKIPNQGVGMCDFVFYRF